MADTITTDFPGLSDLDFTDTTFPAITAVPFSGLSTTAKVALGIGALALVLLLIPDGGGR